MTSAIAAGVAEGGRPKVARITVSSLSVIPTFWQSAVIAQPHHESCIVLRKQSMLENPGAGRPRFNRHSSSVADLGQSLQLILVHVHDGPVRVSAVTCLALARPGIGVIAGDGAGGFRR